ncbi:Gfo/Idh/MocA family oxidoreductase [Virgibacillus halodenitrificans]|uniref:Gfo/Idh/MocA family protein n=1 Tax=Virgibacillus halodenitrificans TaxID=1482 RepID=UPI001FB4A9CB|nr:Gfo/Idh/MocA family oxidoreductase [Virgibacillus halodenitrificans]
MKFSIIGTSWITELFIKATQQTGLTTLHSVYSRKEKSAREFAQKHGAMHWFTDMADMLADNETNFVYIASPNSFHFEHTMKCLESGKHVFCEKPLVFTEKQWGKVKHKADELGLYVFEGYRHLFSPNYHTLKSELKKVGKVRSAMFQYIQYSSKYDRFKNGEEPNVFTKEFAGGALMDLGVYPLSMTIDLFGEPQEIHYFPVHLSNGIDGSGTLILEYGEFNVTILCSKIAQATIPSEIQGEDGTWTMDHISPIDKLTFYDRKTKNTNKFAEEQEDVDMIYELNAFINMINQKDKASYELWMERSRQVAKWTEIARKKQGILFPGE